MAELPLDHVERHALSSHLNSVRMPKLMRHEATTHAGSDRELLRFCCGLPLPYGFHLRVVHRTGRRFGGPFERSTERGRRARVLSP